MALSSRADRLIRRVKVHDRPQGPPAADHALVRQEALPAAVLPPRLGAVPHHAPMDSSGPQGRRGGGAT
jgi:hypothetical protein